MFTYAQIDASTGICYCVSHLSGEIDRDNLIALDGDMNVLGKRWNGSTWEDVQPEPAEELTPEPSNAELQELLLSIMEGLADMYTAESGEAVE